MLNDEGSEPPARTGDEKQNLCSSAEGHQDKILLDLDVEEQIPWSTIRKCPCPKDAAVSWKNVRWNVSLLIRDVLKLQLGGGFLDVKSFRGVHFKTVTVYGQAALKGTRYSKDATLYTVDDGTGAVLVYYPATLKKKNSQFLSTADRLQFELDVFKKHKTPDRSPELIKSLEVMIARIKKQVYIPNEYFKAGTKVSVIGTPYKPPKCDDVRIYAFEMIADDGVNRDKEIFFKDCLMQFYRTNFVPKDVS